MRTRRVHRDLRWAPGPWWGERPGLPRPLGRPADRHLTAIHRFRSQVWAALVEELGHLAVRDGRLKPLVDRLPATVTPAELEAMRRLGYGEDVLVEEALMRRLVAEDLTAQQRPHWQQVKTWLADFCRRTFGKPALDSDLRALLRAAMKAERRRGQSRFSQVADEFRDELRRYQFNELPLAFRLGIRQSGDVAPWGRWSDGFGKVSRSASKRKSA